VCAPTAQKVKGYAAVADALTFFSPDLCCSHNADPAFRLRGAKRPVLCISPWTAHSMLQHAHHSRASQSRRSVYAGWWEDGGNARRRAPVLRPRWFERHVPVAPSRDHAPCHKPAVEWTSVGMRLTERSPRMQAGSTRCPLAGLGARPSGQCVVSGLLRKGA
jgi:hypothetical protein